MSIYEVNAIDNDARSSGAGRRPMKRLAYLFGALAVIAGCHESDIDPMTRQPEKLKAYAVSEYYSGERTMRTPPVGAIPRERNLDAPANPPAITRALLERGKERFEITCGTCHGIVGDGESIVASKMALRAPPTLHTDRIRAYTPPQMFEIITNGYGIMPSYGAEISVADRWAITAYVKALQLSQNAKVDDVPADHRQELESAK
jgi:mono/diheme cytochrome c family protein